MRPSTSTFHRNLRKRQSGSAYLLSLLVLVILTILALSLAMITEAEMLVGSSDRTRQRTFYAADSGLGGSTARALAIADYEAATYELRDPDVDPALDIRNRVDVTPFVPMLSGPCNLCEINHAGPGQQYGSKTYWKITHAVTAQATREGGFDGVPLSQLTISSMVDVEPWEDIAEALLPLMDSEQISKIKF
jgi:Tfp pilus assembly protein PilX